MAGQPMENVLSERSESKGPFAPLRLASFLGELGLGKPAINAKAVTPTRHRGVYGCLPALPSRSRDFSASRSA
jgi:hypothetical protein